MAKNTEFDLGKIFEEAMAPAEEGILKQHSANKAKAGGDEKVGEFVAKLVAKAKKKVASQCKTVEDCKALKTSVREESQKFNQCLRTLIKAAQDYSAGTIDKAKMQEISKPCLELIKKNSDILKTKVAGGFLTSNPEKFTEDDLKLFVGYIKGLNTAIDEVAADIKAKAEAAPATEACGKKKASECGTVEADTDEGGDEDEGSTDDDEFDEDDDKVDDAEAAESFISVCEGYLIADPEEKPTIASIFEGMGF